MGHMSMLVCQLSGKVEQLIKLQSLNLAINEVSEGFLSCDWVSICHKQMVLCWSCLIFWHKSCTDSSFDGYN